MKEKKLKNKKKQTKNEREAIKKEPSSEEHTSVLTSVVIPDEL